MRLTFTFTVEVSPDKKMEYICAGNIEVTIALQILRQIVIMELAKANKQKAKADIETKKETETLQEQKEEVKNV